VINPLSQDNANNTETPIVRVHGGNRAQQHLTLLALSLLVSAAGLFTPIVGLPKPTHALALPTVAVALLFLMAELGRLHIEIRRSAITLSLSDAALIVGLFTLAPAHVVLLRLVVCFPVLAVLYRHSPIRFAVNTGTMLLESAACATVLTSLGAANPTSLRSWLIAMVAVQVSGLLSGLVVNLAIKLNGDTETLRDVIGGLALGAGVSGVTGVLGIMCVGLTASGPAGRWLLAAAVVVGLLVYRGYARLFERKTALEAVHGFSRSLDTDAGTHALLENILVAVPALVGAARAEILLPAAETGHSRVALVDGKLRIEPAEDIEWPIRRVLGTGQAVAFGRHNRQRRVRELLRSASMRELMIAPLPTEHGATGAVIAMDRLGQVRGFRRADLMLFETLALHAAVALQNVELVDQLRHDIDHDRLTGLMSRSGIVDLLRERDAGSVVLVQLSSLGDVNDALGHTAGDALLVAAADRVRSGVRAGTPVGRIDNDVFAVLLDAADPVEVEAFGERMQSRFSDAVEIDDVPISMGSSIGIASGRAGDNLLRQAEIALRAAGGRDGGFRVYEPGMEPPSARRLSIAAELRQVLADQKSARDVVTFYQPKADMKTGRVQAVEALVRWMHRDRGLVPPADFIPVVESTGLVRPLTIHVLHAAMRDAKRWQLGGRALSVAVNLSAHSLHDPRLVGDVMSVLSAHDADPSLLTLEITESAVMDDPDRARDVLEELAALGVSLSVDDFGTGYSSLAYLARLPVSEVKVDRMFVSRMTSDPRDAAVVRSVVDLGHSLNLRVVAEGVEDRACWNALIDAGVDVAQGYLLSRPVPAEDLERWLSQRDAESAAHVEATT